MVGSGFFCRQPDCICTTFQPLQATSTQPTPVIFPDLSSKPQVSALAPAHTIGCLSQAGACRLAALSYVGLSVLPATNHLLYSPLSLHSSLSLPVDLPKGEGASQGVGLCPLLLFPPRIAGCILLPFLLLPPSPYPVMWRSFLSLEVFEVFC